MLLSIIRQYNFGVFQITNVSYNLLRNTQERLVNIGGQYSAKI